VRTEGWRYIRYANGEEELYDEVADPLEYTNLADHTEHQARKAELRLDTREGALRGSNPVILPGKSAASELVRRLVAKESWASGSRGGGH